MMLATLIGCRACGCLKVTVDSVLQILTPHVVEQTTIDKIDNICYCYPIVLLILSSVMLSMWFVASIMDGNRFRNINIGTWIHMPETPRPLEDIKSRKKRKLLLYNLMMMAANHTYDQPFITCGQDKIGTSKLMANKAKTRMTKTILLTQE